VVLDGPQNRAPVVLGDAPAGQRRALLLDLGHPVAFAVIVLALPLARESGLAYLVLLLVLIPGALLLLNRRLAELSVELVDNTVVITNAFRTYRVPVESIARVVVRRSWFGGIYCYCFGLRLRSINLRVPQSIVYRSVALHAVSGGDAGRAELVKLLGIR
jgi:hypothetical protein